MEEFGEGPEYCVEDISWEGRHHFLALTHKFTSGAPYFVETGHMEPAPVSDETLIRVQNVVCHALDSLGIQYGASHSELKIATDGTIRIIEIGGRMGGDFIGSDLVRLSTGFDFVESVIKVALGHKPVIEKVKRRSSGVRFIFDEHDVDVYRQLEYEHPEYIV